MIGRASLIRGGPIDLYGRCTAMNTTNKIASPEPTEGYLLQRVDVQSITATAYIDGQQFGESEAPAVADVFYDTLQTEPLFRVGDRRGGNTHFQAPARFFDTDATQVRVVIFVTLKDGTGFPWCTDVDVIQSTISQRSGRCR